jgi:hypothetical protein
MTIADIASNLEGGRRQVHSRLRLPILQVRLHFACRRRRLLNCFHRRILRNGIHKRKTTGDLRHRRPLGQVHIGLPQLRDAPASPFSGYDPMFAVHSWTPNAATPDVRVTFAGRRIPYQRPCRHAHLAAVGRLAFGVANKAIEAEARGCATLHVIGTGCRAGALPVKSHWFSRSNDNGVAWLSEPQSKRSRPKPVAARRYT